MSVIDVFVNFCADVDINLDVGDSQAQVPNSRVLVASTVRQMVCQPPPATAPLDTSVSSWPPPPPQRMELLVTSVQLASTALRGLPHPSPAVLEPTVLQH